MEPEELYIYLGPGAGYGVINYHEPTVNHYNWWKIEPLSDDPKDIGKDELYMEDEEWKKNSRKNPRRIRELRNWNPRVDD